MRTLANDKNSPREASAPDQTRRAKQFREQHPSYHTQPPRQVPVSAESKRVHLVINVEHPIPDRYPLSMGWSIGPADYLPMEDEAPWPDIGSTQAIQELADSLRNGSNSTEQSVERFLDQAQVDGLFTASEPDEERTPWHHVLSMYAHFAEELLETPLFSSYELEQFTQTRETAQTIISLYPNEPVAEYARLLELEVLRNARLNAQEHVYVEQTLLHILEHTQDNMVLEAAASVLSEESILERSAALQNWTKTHIDRLPTHAAEVMAVQQITAHTKTKSPEECSFWIQKYRDLLDERCLIESQCAEEYQRLDTHEGALSAHGSIPPNTWRAALTGIMIQCHAQKPLEVPLKTSLEWDGNTWKPSPPIHHCFTGHTPELNPMLPILIDLELVRGP